MQNALKTKEWKRIWVPKTFEIEIKNEYFLIMQNALKPNEWQIIFFLKTFKIEIEKERPNNSAVLQNWFRPRK